MIRFLSLSPTSGDRLTERKKLSTAELLANLPGMPGSYLDLSILVQNRRKAEPVVVVGKAFLAVTTKKGKSKAMEGKKPADIISMIPHPEGFVSFFIWPCDDGFRTTEDVLTH